MMSGKDVMWVLAVWALIKISAILTKGTHLRILGGWSDHAGEYPYVVRLESNKTLIEPYEVHSICTGMLVAKEWVLTAAHCIITQVQIVRYGDVTLPHKDSTTSKILKKILHKKYFINNYSDLKNDIALLLIEPVQLQTGNLASVDFKTLIGEQATVAGYGRTSENKSLAHRLELERTPLQIGRGMIIAARSKILIPALVVAPECTKADHGPYQGDSGGPLVVKGKIVGITSIAHGKHSPHIQYYTPVSPYLDWIKRVTNTLGVV